jgi:hypothetical protein
VSNNTSSDDVTKLIGVIEGALVLLKGRDNTPKTKILMEAIVSSRLFNGEVANLLHEKIKNRKSYCHWKLVKAADVMAVGAFESSTRNAFSVSHQREKIRTISICKTDQKKETGKSNDAVW